jgi:multicomponent Na+:H+ antiporter subunit C
MSSFIYEFAGIGLVVIGLLGMLLVSHLVRKVLALNVMCAGVLMLFVSLAHPPPAPDANPGLADPVPHALVLTGLVVAVSTTALALTLVVSYYQQSGRTSLPEDTPA